MKNTGWLLTGNRKQKSRSKSGRGRIPAWKFRNLGVVAYTREFLKEYLIEEQSGYFLSSRFREVVAYQKWLLQGSQL